MKAVRIEGPESPYYRLFKELYEESFPLFEQRTEEQQISAFGSRDYHLVSYFSDSQFLGFISYWDFGSYAYIEHFAVTACIRGKGYGSRILETFGRQVPGMVLLEIDPVRDEVSEARLQFYRKNGFHDNGYIHHHPAYREGYAAHDLVVLSSGRPISEKEYMNFRSDLYNKVMGSHCL